MLDFSNIQIVLVNTSHPGNIGAAARAMKNMGLSQLTLVDPVDFPSGVAVGRAVSAVNILESAKVVATLEEAVADCGLVIGASARSRRIPWPCLTPTQSAEKVVQEVAKNRVALVFGREDSGLSNDELQLCHFHVQIPTSAELSSLNLAAAVLVICYEVRKAFLEQKEKLEDKPPVAEDEVWDMERATGQEMEYFYEHLEKVMIEIDFHDPDNPRMLMKRMRRLYGRIRVDKMEMNILRGILSNVQYHIKHRNDEK